MSVLIMQAALLARKRGSAIDPDAQAIIDRMDTPPSEKYANAINETVVSLKSANLWDRFDSIYLPIDAENQQAACLDWKRNVSADIIGIASWSASRGFVGGSGDSGADTKFSLTDASNKLKYDNMSITVIQESDFPAVTDGGYLFSQQQTTGGSVYIRNIDSFVGSSGAGAIGSGIATAGIALYAKGDIYSVVRNNNSQVRHMRSGIHNIVATSSASGMGAYYGALRLCALVSSTGLVIGTNGICIGFSAIGESITLAEQATLKSIYNSYRAAMAA